MATNENLPPNVIKQIAREVKNLDEIPPEGIKVSVNDDDFSTIYADIEGPAGTPYENGIFRMKLLLSRDFPHSPPKGYFLTKIFHPNIASNGEICVNTLKRDWNSSLGLRHVVIVVRCLLIEPFAESALNEQAGKMLLENYDEYARHARIYTGIHAIKPKPKLKTGGAICESTTSLNVDQKNIVPSNGTFLPSASAGVTKVDGNQEQQHRSILGPSNDAGGIGGSSAAAPAVAAVKKEHGFAKVVLDNKKKIDARKKSLKRL